MLAMDASEEHGERVRTRPLTSALQEPMPGAAALSGIVQRDPSNGAPDPRAGALGREPPYVRCKSATLRAGMTRLEDGRAHTVRL